MYEIRYEREYALLVVRFNGRKIGTSPTEAGARLIRRNHRRHQS